ncbi:GW dipeptide domain-containing protein [Apilactobacillus apisilvae]|uniref:GW dipeptide domain-containing protein n=1 Tax=Apilactobacillus apisilvae TaxID=2923364 RepID=A0ABY4PGA2_9LACO|nr:GH25 family lysozyme [Apilactobacillus apisilvae]UQS84602.1 GW dipeptide domain-containing protein [Apilactobacillus apisilvae]
MKIKNFVLTFIAFTLLMVTFSSTRNNVHAASVNDANTNNTIYDLSEWQHNFTDAQVQQLKGEVPFVILRVQYGSQYADKTFQHNRDLLNQYGIPYGVYSFSQYDSPSDAADEARTLYKRAPNARFYVNDYEAQTVTSGGTNNATKAWVNALRPLVGQRKILLYSNAYFMQSHAADAVSSYDGFWLAAYQNNEPSREHVLWQFASDFYSNALGQNIDANLLNSKDASWFIGDTADVNTQPSSVPSTSDDSSNTQNNTSSQSVDQNQANAQSGADKDVSSDNNSDQSNTSSQDTSDQTSSDQGQNNNSNQSQTKPKNTQYVQQSKTMTIKSGYDYQIYNHVPGDNKFEGQTYSNGSVSDYTRKRVYINSIATVNGRTYYRMYSNGHALGWVNTKALVPNVKYSNVYTTKVMKSNPKVAFHNHVNNSGFANTKTTAHGYTYANKRMTINRRAIKDGWNSYYYQAYYHGKLVGWIYQSAFK